MSECGICSRRHAEDAIARGEVRVNGAVAQIGQSVDPEKDHIEFGGKLIKRSEALVYYAVNKPRGIETTCAQKGGQSIVDIVDIPTRVFPIGRLDKDSSGLILMTNDGRLTHRLLHPSFEHEKEYLVTTYGKIDDHSLDALRSGVRYSVTEGPKTGKDAKAKLTQWGAQYSKRLPPIGKKWFADRGTPGLLQLTKFVQTLPCEVKRASSDTFTIVLTEGKNRQIRRMVEACGHQVKRLKRIRIEHILLGIMPDGAYRELKRGEREELLRRAALPLVDYAPIVGEVVHGDGRGHSLGFPTANIVMAADVLPNETFSCRVKIGEEVYLWAGSYQPKKWHFEVHIVGFDRDIYGETIHIDIMDSIRVNQHFTSIDELKKQIEKDVNHVRAHWRAILSDKK